MMTRVVVVLMGIRLIMVEMEEVVKMALVGR